ncbi:hypothetical protein AB3N61_05730 [Leptospira sp. WS58.C1]|uniref:hypothetical protein n=1 Tax=Leptospira cinconiae TaxID=3235173 RepID=UPI00349ED558
MKKIVLVVYCLFLGFCSGGRYEIYSKTGTSPDLNGAKIDLYKPLFLKDIAGFKTSESAYYKNAYLGFISFSGGLIRVKTALGDQVSTKTISFESEAMFRELAEDAIQKYFREKLLSKNINYKESQHSLPEKNWKITSKPVYILDKYSGTENINLPQMEYIYNLSISDTELEKISADYLLIPVVERFYVHNAGWFMGQDWGCQAGVRFALKYLIFSKKAKNIIYSFGLEQRRIESKRSIYNVSEVNIYSNEIIENTLDSLLQNFP